MTFRPLLLFVFIASVLFACGGDKKIQTEDDSADYKSAQALPPLKKKSSPLPRSRSAPVIPESYVPEEASDNSVTASVVSVGKNYSRLQINAEFDQAWDVLGNALQSSNVTVHNRNRDAGRVAIGCGELDDAQPQEASGGWSIFSRKPKKGLEYCALQLLAQKRNTTVQVLNRNAQEVDKEAAEQVFNQILRNLN